MLIWNFEDIAIARRWLRMGYMLVGMLTTDYPEQAKELNEVLDTVQDIIDMEEDDIPF